MVLDQVENFIRVSVSGSHASGDSTISLQSGEASTLPDPRNGKYNLVWFDSQNYRLPDKDPNVEIIRVNSVDTANDTVSVTRGQENTAATTKSDTGAEYELLLGPTAKTIQEIDQFKLDASAYSPEADTHTRYDDSEAINAVNSTTDSLTAPLYSHQTDISSSVTIPEGFATVVSGPLKGSDPISGRGRIAGVGDGSSITSHDNLADIGSSDHHTRYSDSEASSAAPVHSVNGETGNISINGFSGSHTDLTDIGSSDHHTKTTSSSDLTDVSADSVSNAHHTKTTSSSELTDVSADSVSNAHHTKTTSSSELTDVSADSVSNAHHTKTTSSSELTDVSADSVSNAHHTRYSDSEASNAAPVQSVNGETGNISIEGKAGVVSTFVAAGVIDDNINSNKFIDWAVETTNTGSYSFNGRTITIPSNGIYEVHADIDFQSNGSSRQSPNISILRNGILVGVVGRSGYMRDAEGHNHSSIHASFIGSLSSGDDIRVQTSRDADGGTVSPERGHVYIKRIE